MDQATHRLCENVQEITLYAYDKVYADDQFGLGNQSVLEELRGWAEEFEAFWQSHDEEWLCDHDYLDEIWAFTDKKIEEYLKNNEVCS